MIYYLYIRNDLPKKLNKVAYNGAELVPNLMIHIYILYRLNIGYHLIHSMIGSSLMTTSFFMISMKFDT